jgi:lactate dehydrogenase-like 2-hydroxyacid dehydrogenase
MLLRFKAEFQVTRLFDTPESDRATFLAKNGADFTAVATDGHWGLPAGVLEALPNLKVVSSYGVGYDSIDTDAAVARGVIVAHTPDVLNDEVADTAILLWLAVSRGLLAADQWARSGQWQEQGGFPLTRSVRGTTVGILGLGRIGQTIATRASAFGANIIYHARSPKSVDYPYFDNPIAMATACDSLICITPGGAATHNLVNADVINALGPQGILVNVSRGSVVDETALVDALQQGRLGGAGLDVFAAEPAIPDALKAMSNVVLTPHVGSATIETRQAMGDLTCDNLSRFLVDGRVLTPVPECQHM